MMYKYKMYNLQVIYGCLVNRDVNMKETLAHH